MSSEGGELRALGEVDRPIYPGVEIEAAIEAKMFAAFDDAAIQRDGGTGPEEVLDLSGLSDERRYRRHRPWIALSVAATTLVLLASVVAIALQRSQGEIATTPPDRSFVSASVDGLCRIEMSQFVSAFETYRDADNPFRNEGRDEELVRARTEFIAAIEREVSVWSSRYQELVSDQLDEAQVENDRARELLGGPSPLIDPHHAASQEALVGVFASVGLPGTEGCETAGIEWRPGG